MYISGEIQNMELLNKIGTNKEIVEILKKAGWQGNYNNFQMQKSRNSLSKEVSLILWDYCQKNNIPVSIEDFKE